MLRRAMAVGERMAVGEEGEEWKAGWRLSVGGKERVGGGRMDAGEGRVDMKVDPQGGRRGSRGRGS